MLIIQPYWSANTDDANSARYVGGKQPLYITLRHVVGDNIRTQHIDVDHAGCITSQERRQIAFDWIHYRAKGIHKRLPSFSIHVALPVQDDDWLCWTYNLNLDHELSLISSVVNSCVCQAILAFYSYQCSQLEQKWFQTSAGLTCIHSPGSCDTHIPVKTVRCSHYWVAEGRVPLLHNNRSSWPAYDWRSDVYTER